MSRAMYLAKMMDPMLVLPDPFSPNQRHLGSKHVVSLFVWSVNYTATLSDRTVRSGPTRSENYTRPKEVARVMSSGNNGGYYMDPLSYLEGCWVMPPTGRAHVALKRKAAVSMARFYQDLHHNWDSNSAQVLELGGGPSIGNLLSIGPYVSKITFTDYLPTNVEQVALWKEKSPKSFNWDATFEHVAKEIVGQGDIKTVVTEWQDQLREKLTTLGHCDCTREGFIDPSLVPVGGFDILISSGTLEHVAKDVEEFTQMLKTCHSLLCKGGFLATATYGRSTGYKLDGTEYQDVYLTEEAVQMAMTEAGFTIDRFEQIISEKLNYFCVARKKH